jgi:hypothetical protein
MNADKDFKAIRDVVMGDDHHLRGLAAAVLNGVAIQSEIYGSQAACSY